MGAGTKSSDFVFTVDFMNVFFYGTLSGVGLLNNKKEITKNQFNYIEFNSL